MNLLKIEWLKLRKYNTFWILSGLFTFLFILWNYGIANSFISMKGNNNPLFGNSYGFPAVWGNMGYVYSWFVIFLCVFVIISVSNEFTFRTNKQHIIDGMRRIDFLHAKVLLVLTISLAATLLFFVTALLFGTVNGGGDMFPGMEKTLYVFLFTLNYISFAMLLAFFVKRSGLSIILLFAYFIVEAILGGVINWQFKTYAGDLLFLQCSDELLPLQVLKQLGSLTGSKPEAPVYLLCSFSIFYIGLYYFILRRKILHSDL